MKTDSVVNLAALAALCGTAGVAGYYNQYRKRERDADKIREVLNDLKEQQDFNKEAYCKRYFMRKTAAKVYKPGKGTMFDQPEVSSNLFHPGNVTSSVGTQTVPIETHPVRSFYPQEAGKNSIDPAVWMAGLCAVPAASTGLVN